ncbi:MAG: adenylate/guanylate cyclase domain-containing protein [Candidatus Tectimicrobiota bacterium]
MLPTRARSRYRVYHSIVFNNVLLFLCILAAAVVPLAARYYQDSRDYEIQNLASKLEFFAERGASWIDVDALLRLTAPEHKQTPDYTQLLKTLQRIEREFDVDNAVVMRREKSGHYTYIAIGHDAFDIGMEVHIHTLFPATYLATNDTWKRGEMMHSQLFGGTVGEQEFAQFLQINTPLKLQDQVVAILMLNKFAEPVAQAVRVKTFWVVGTTVVILGVGLALFGLLSARMLQPLKALTATADEVARDNLDITVPVHRSRDEVGRLTVSFHAMLMGLRQHHFLRDAFGRYLSEEVAHTLLESPDGLKLGGELRDVTFLVSDLRGFSALASRLSPHDVLTIMNRYLERMVEIVMRYRGTINEFQGDGILAFFGAPLLAPDDPERAIACAIEMQCALAELNTEQRRLGLPELGMGIGLNTGEVIVGNIGSEKRAKYTALGSALNIAYRIESYTVAGQILISTSLYKRVHALVHVQDSLMVQFKGIEQMMLLYDINALHGPYQLALPDKAPEIFVVLDPPLALQCYVLTDKTVTDEAIPGSMTRLAVSTAEIRLAAPVAVHMNVKLTLACQGTADITDVYAKVQALAPPQAAPADTQVSIVFTSLPEEAQMLLEHHRAAAFGAASVL